VFILANKYHNSGIPNPIKAQHRTRFVPVKFLGMKNFTFVKSVPERMCCLNHQPENLQSIIQYVTINYINQKIYVKGIGQWNIKVFKIVKVM